MTLAGVNGDIRLAGGRTFIDPFGSSTLDESDASAVRIYTAGPAELGGTDWEIVSRRDSSVEINHPFENLGGIDWEFRLTLAESSIETAVIAGTTYRLR